MKIAILTSERTGSTTLFHMIREHLVTNSYLCHIEPFNQFLNKNIGRVVYDTEFYKNKNKIFIKTFLSPIHRPKDFLEKENEYWVWFFNYFDKIILLDRKDKTLQSESFTFHSIKSGVTGWHKRQFYDLSNINQEFIDRIKYTFFEESEKLHEISKKGYPIFYFEDIYIERKKSVIQNMFEYIGIELNDQIYTKHVFSDGNRVRLKDGEPPYSYLI